MATPIEVRATQRGYYKGVKEAGDRFMIDDESEAGAWMVRADGDEPFDLKARDPNAGAEMKLVSGADGTARFVRADGGGKEPAPRPAGAEVVPIPDANFQGPQTVNGADTPNYDPKVEGERAEFLARARERADADKAPADASDATGAKRKGK